MVVLKRSVGSAASLIDVGDLICYSGTYPPVAQLVEHLPFKELVVGSIPTGRTEDRKSALRQIFCCCPRRSDVASVEATASQGRAAASAAAGAERLTTVLSESQRGGARRGREFFQQEKACDDMAQDLPAWSFMIGSETK